MPSRPTLGVISEPAQKSRLLDQVRERKHDALRMEETSVDVSGVTFYIPSGGMTGVQDAVHL